MEKVKEIKKDTKLIKIINKRPEELPVDMSVCFIGCKNDTCASCDGVCVWG